MPYKVTKHKDFIHQEDKCPSDCSAHKNATCAAYDSSSEAITYCTGHRNVDTRRTRQFQEYGKGSTIENPQINTITTHLKTEQLSRVAHVWYSNLNDLTSVNAGDLVEHGQENDINDAIIQLNTAINGLSDWGISEKAASLSKVSAGAVAYAQDIKRLEQHVLSAVRDCICYSDCTCHGLSCYTTRKWCGGYGSGDY